MGEVETIPQTKVYYENTRINLICESLNKFTDTYFRFMSLIKKVPRVLGLLM